jgi:hypothetical protein
MALLLLLMIWHSARTTAEAVQWVLVGGVFAVLVPLGYVLRGVRRHRLTDRHVSVRQQRPIPLLIGIVSAGVGLTLLAKAGAPWELLAFLTAMIGLGIAALLITLAWKISVHVAVVAAAAAITTLVVGPGPFGAVGLAGLVVVVGWARVEVDAHSPAQTFAGALLGAATGAVFALLR